MRKPNAASIAATRPFLPTERRTDASTQLVCVALALAIAVLAARIVSVW
jgi:hypothetical protein